MNEDYVNKQADGEEPPPIMKSWNKLYLFLLVQTAALIVVFYLFTRFFR